MADFLRRLTRMVPPPSTPVENGDISGFNVVEAELCLRLPEDFKQLIATYGTGQWQQFWYLLNPFTANPHLNFAVQTRNLRPRSWSALDAERGMREVIGEHYPYPIYPEEGGILPWAVTDNGGRFFWLTSGPPDKWPTVYYADRSPDF